jgi:UDP-glucose 4-epimerase
MNSPYHDRKVIVTGGLGFIGSNLAMQLAQVGARVIVIDSSVTGCGANPFNLAAMHEQVRLVAADIGDPAIAQEIAGAFAVFNLAGEISHIHSMRQPLRDAAINAFAQLRFVETCGRAAPGVRVVYAGTRQIYGVPQYLPVDESHPIRPVDFNGIHKYAATQYHLMWNDMGRIDARVLRLSNVYGPRMALSIPCQGFLGNFLRRALLGQTIEIFGDGSQVRDPVYVDDVVDAFLLAGAADDARSRVWNVGGAEPLSLASIAASLCRESGAPEPVLRPFPAEHKSIDIGSYSTDTTLIRRELGWQPRVSFSEGARRSIDYYRGELAHYLGDGADACALDGRPLAV